jgi:hypothetical protein
MAYSKASTDLFLMNLKCVTVLHIKLQVRSVGAHQNFHNSATHSVWTVGRLDSAAIEQESHRAWGATLSLAERVHQLLQSSSPLNLEEDFVVVVGDLDIEVVIVLGFLWYCWATAVV